MKNIVLVGFMGTGKSVVGQALARRFQCPFVDVDAAIESAQGRPIRKIFAEDGEAAFREAERAMIAQVASRDGQVIAAGGGAVMDDANRAALAKTGWLVWLKAEPDAILQRIGNPASRPLLAVDDPKGRMLELLALREATYATADAAIDTTSRTVEQVVDEILKVKPW